MKNGNKPLSVPTPEGAEQETLLGIPGLQPASSRASESSSPSSVDLRGRRRGAQDLRFLLEAVRERFAKLLCSRLLPFDDEDGARWSVGLDELHLVLRDAEALLSGVSDPNSVAERSGAVSRPRSALVSDAATDSDLAWFDCIARALRAAVRNASMLRAKLEDSEQKRADLEERLVASQEATAQALGALKFAREREFLGWCCTDLHCSDGIDPSTGHCQSCGLDHSEPCADCGLRGTHHEGCSPKRVPLSHDVPGFDANGSEVAP